MTRTTGRQPVPVWSPQKLQAVVLAGDEATRKWIWHQFQKAYAHQRSQRGGHFSCHPDTFFLHVKPGKVRPTHSQQSHQMVGEGQQFQSRVWREVSTGCSKHAQLGSHRLQARCWAPGGSSLLRAGQDTALAALTIMTSKCRHPETYQEGASLKPTAPEPLVGWSFGTRVTPTPDTDRCVALGQSRSLSEPQGL